MFNTQPLSLDDAKKAMREPKALTWLLAALDQQRRSVLDRMSTLVFEALDIDSPVYSQVILEHLLKLRPQWANLKAPNSNTVLMEAVRRNRLDLVDTLLDAGAKTGTRNTSGFNALDIAAYWEGNHRWQAALADALLERARFTQSQKDRALCVAASTGNLGMTRRLLKHGAVPGMFYVHRTALAHAAMADEQDHPSVEIVNALLATAPGLHAIDHGWEGKIYSAPIHCAANIGNMGVLKALLRAGAAVNPPRRIQRQNPRTALMQAAYGLQPEAIEVLLAAGADATLVDEHDRNALHYLASSDSELDSPVQDPLLLKAMAALIQAGADPKARDLSGSMPQDSARENGRIMLADALAAHASSVDLHASTPTLTARRPRPAGRL